MAYLTANYCPGLEGHEEQCENDLTRNYVQMLFMIVQHFFVDGAQHICEAWNICPVPQDAIVPEPHPFTCDECVEGLEVVGAYMTDPLWIAEYTLYLEQNFCDVAQDTFPYTCEECIEGLEVVGAYMTDPLWIAEYTLYLEQNFCVGHPDRCVEVVKK